MESILDQKKALLRTDPPFHWISVGHRLFAKVDRDDYDEIRASTWKVRRGRQTNYAVRAVKKGRREYLIQMHRQIMRTPKGQWVHHINGDGLDNRKCNLYNCSRSDHRNLHGGKLWRF